MYTKNKQEIISKGFIYLRAKDILLSQKAKSEWYDFSSEFDNLLIDKYLPGNDKYRKRSYGIFHYNPSSNRLFYRKKTTSFFQSEEINRAVGGINRKFGKLSNKIIKGRLLGELIKFDFQQLPISRSDYSYIWHVGVHMIRVTTSVEKIGLPAPEGAHQDGHDFVAQHLIKKQNVDGGLTVIFDLDEKPINAVLLKEDLDTVYVSDKLVKHFATPIIPKEGWYEGHRDMLLIDFKKVVDIKN